MRRGGPIEPKKTSELTERKKQLKKDDAAARKLCKSIGYCQLRGLDFIECSNDLTWGHVLRRKHSEVRHLAENGLCLCLAHHDYYNVRQQEFEALVESLFPGRMEFLNSLVRRIVK